MLHGLRKKCERYSDCEFKALSDIYSSLLLTALAAARSRKRYVIGL